MKRCIVGGVAALVMAAEVIASAAPASAGCLYGGPVLSKCDGPVQPDGTWQRCVGVARWNPSGMSTYLAPERHCDLMGPDHHPGDLALADPPTHIDD
jgi:hypothetical protein